MDAFYECCELGKNLLNKNEFPIHLEGIIRATVPYITNSLAPEPKGSSPHSQEPANRPYPEPGASTPHPPNQSPQDPF
jgi:hypothetical protein